MTHPGRGIRRGRKPGDPLVDDRRQAKAEYNHAYYAKQKEREIAALSPPPPPPDPAPTRWDPAHAGTAGSPPAPARGPTAKPATDAYQLVRAIATARLLRDWPTADKLLAELQRLAERPRRTEGEHDEQYG
jgi:hypothetical protein